MLEGGPIEGRKRFGKKLVCVGEMNKIREVGDLRRYRDDGLIVFDAAKPVELSSSTLFV
jgi:hypothetical protein